MLSIIIPSYKDPLLHKTIDDLLHKSEGEIEIIAIIDGYELKQDIINDKRVKVLYLGKNRGMREAINAGVKVARGEYLMRVDEHQIFGQGYDRILTETCQDNWIVTPTRYFLDVENWEIMDIPPVSHEKLIIDKTRRKFTAHKQPELDANCKEKICEKSAMQGSCWVMPKKWWDTVIMELQSEGYGTHYQDSVEMIFKTWKAGGKLMVNKNTWHSHKHRQFPRTHNYGGKEADDSFAYALSVWGEYYEELKKQGKI